MNYFSLAKIFGNHMVIQRCKPIRIYGVTYSQENLSVTLGNQKRLLHPEQSEWECEFSALEACENLTLTVSQGTQEVVLHDICIGDVWIAGGQSNMEFALRYEKHWGETQTLPSNSLIRLYSCPRKAYEEQKPYLNYGGSWFSADSDQLEFFSSIGYYFAYQIQSSINVPIGIISCNWGGTSASAWVPPDVLQSSPLNIYLKDYSDAVKKLSPLQIEQASKDGWAFQETPVHQNEWTTVMYGIDRDAQFIRIKKAMHNPIVPMGPYNKNRPSALYEYMIKPIVRFPVKGVLWYQGENDVHHASIYSTLFSSLINSWRDAWKDQLPFLFVQLAPFEQWLALDGNNFPEIRHQQQSVRDSLPLCWMTSSMDVGMQFDIHPKEKRELARRLVLLALQKIYDVSLESEPPEFSAITRTSDETLEVTMKNCAEGLHSTDSVADLFELFQGEKRVTILGVSLKKQSILIHCSPLGHEPATLYFAAKPFSKVCLYNQSNISAIPFTTTV